MNERRRLGCLLLAGTTPGTLQGYVMTTDLARLAEHVCTKLRILGFSSPSLLIMQRLLDTAYLASMKTEESRLVRGTLTYSDPEAPHHDPPLKRRADYPSFTPLGHRTALTPEALVKL